MNDRLAPFESRGERCRISHVADTRGQARLAHTNALAQRGRRTRGANECHHAMPRLNQCGDDMAPNEPCPTGNEDSCHW